MVILALYEFWQVGTVYELLVLPCESFILRLFEDVQTSVQGSNLLFVMPVAQGKKFACLIFHKNLFYRRPNHSVVFLN